MSAPARLVFALALGLFALSPGLARAEEPVEAVFAQGVAALGRGAFPDAIDAFESLADRGFVHPDASFDRALAYLGRVRAGAERPGDLGRAAAALEETLGARPSDREAEAALELLRAEVARRRARGGGEAEVEAKPTIDRALVGLASESLWAVLAAISSAILTLGLVLRRTDRESAAHLAGTIAAPIGGVALLVFSMLAWGSLHLRLSKEDAVVVVPEARLVDERGAALPSSPPIPEAARVEAGERRGALVRVRWGAVEGFTQASAIRVIGRP